MRISICDDEVSMVQILEEKIKKLLPDAVIEKYLSGDELIASGSKPDILFLDIQMPGMGEAALIGAGIIVLGILIGRFIRAGGAW